MGMRRAVLFEARQWIDTPYLHQASVKGVGCDCLGLVRGVWRELHGAEPEAPPPYTPGWGEGDGTEPLLAAAARWLAPREGAPLPGDVLTFRMARGGPAKHCGVYVGEDRFVHAYSGRAVTAAWLSRWWRARVAGVFGFPEAPPSPDRRRTATTLPWPASGGTGRGAGGEGAEVRSSASSRASLLAVPPSALTRNQ